MAFHAGVLHYLASRSRLESVAHVSSVSGGSLLVGIVLGASGYEWPTSSAYSLVVFQRVRELLTTRSLQSEALRQLVLRPLNWRFILSRANVIAQAIRKLWTIDVTLGALDPGVVWTINATAAETGRRFRFKSAQMGDYELGYADATGFPLSQAIAVSAAFPGGIGPLSIRSSAFTWMKRKSWDSADGEILSGPPFKTLHLYDGGLYDNLGLEPFFDVGRQSFKGATPELDYLIGSDGGAPFRRCPIPGSMNPWRFRRIAAIAEDQTRALRVRSFVHFLQQRPHAGAYLQIGAVPGETIEKYSRQREEEAGRLFEEEWLDADSVKEAAAFPTCLRRMSEEEFDLLSRHGFETAKWNVELFSGW